MVEQCLMAVNTEEKEAWWACAQVLAAGGSSQYCATAMTPGSTTSFLVDVTPGANHTIVQEQAHIPRVVRLVESLNLADCKTVDTADGLQS